MVAASGQIPMAANNGIQKHNHYWYSLQIADQAQQVDPEVEKLRSTAGRPRSGCRLITSP